jgi:hypothetical protein
MNKMKTIIFKRELLLVGSIAIVAALWLASSGSSWLPEAKAADTQPATANQELVALRAEVERLKGLVPDQAHAMKDVGYHFANLWFAGQNKNWALADFYWAETRSHLRWAVRIIPVRKDAQGKDIRLLEILEPIERTSLEEIHKAIREKDGQKFTTAYKQMLDSCYACHLASAKPFLTLQIPQQPEASIIRFDPAP